MTHSNPLSASFYRETRIKTASQGQLILMLYDGAIKQLDHSLELIDRSAGGRKDPGKIEKINKAILKTQEIITELIVSLDFDQGGEIAANLFSLYTWFNQELLAANIAQDSKKITTICKMLRELRGAWGEIIAKTSMEGVGSPSSGINIAG